ncbi:MAG: tetratricopeptide repeat-containing sulfotransferase family protein [Woeseiaceae bacterium]
MKHSAEIETLSLQARQAARARDWRTVSRCARQILEREGDSAEGHFLAGQAAKAVGGYERAEKSFQRALRNDHSRYDAAVEVAELYVRQLRNREALELLRACDSRLANSPVYLEMAAAAYTRMDLHERALPLYRRACELQPEIERFRTGLAACSVFLGKIDDAIGIYEELLQRHPEHRRFHYELAQLREATDGRHVEQMKAILAASTAAPADNIFLYYALGKEFEELGWWEEAFQYYKQGGDAAKSVSPYDVSEDVELIEAVISCCSGQWLDAAPAADNSGNAYPKPVFVVGLPRSGTTLTERIISSHSLVGTVGETFFLQHVLRSLSGVRTKELFNVEILRAAAAGDTSRLMPRYLAAVDYRLGKEPYFVEKYPENFLLLGFIVRGIPDAAVVHVSRHPMDVCFAIYKQSYFRYAYTLDDLGRYYVAYERLMQHWRALLGERLLEVSYEALVAEPELRVRDLLSRLGLGYEEACLRFERSRASTRTASAVQVREKIHSRSVGRWKHFENELAPLREYLREHGIAVS